MNTYDKGDLVRVTGVFYDINDALIDPTVVRFKFSVPGAAATTYVYGTDTQLVRASAGRYYVDLSVTVVGIWRFRWESTGTGQAAEEGEFVVPVGNF